MAEVKPVPVPRLRFPEFRDAGPWERATIGEIGSFYYGKSAPKWSLDDDATTPCVRYGELYTRFGPIITKTYSRTSIDPSNLRFSKGGEILVPRVGEKPDDFGKSCCFLPMAGIAIGEMISVFETQQNSVFYMYYFRALYKEFAKVVEGQNVKNLYYSELEPLTIFRPPIAEQQKIADCLTSLDDLIRAEEDSAKALREHKQGLMQHLFPAPGETTPRLRFPEFRDDPMWPTPQLSDLYSFKRTNSLSRDKLNYKTGTIRNIHYGDIHSKFKPLFRAKDEHLPFINDASAASNFSDDAFCDEGDIVLADASEDLDDVGKAIEVVSLDGERIVAGTHTILATRRGGQPVVGFGGYLFQSTAVRAGIKKEAQGTKVYGISASRVSSVPIPIPPTEMEQQKIADCLTSLDDLIRAQEERIGALRDHKRGLMQQLFPSKVG